MGPLGCAISGFPTLLRATDYVLHSMLPKRYRLPVQTVTRKRGSVQRGNGFTLKAFATSLSYSRFNVVVPKAAIKTAVKRNALRRQILDAFGALRNTLQRPYDLLLIVSQPGATLTKDGMIKELQKLITQLVARSS